MCSARKALAHLSTLNNLKGLQRTNQIEEDKYLTQFSQISASVLSLKDQLIVVIKNPDAIHEMKFATVTPTQSVGSPTLVHAPTMNVQTPNDWFKKVIIGLFALFGIAVMGSIFFGTFFSNRCLRFHVGDDLGCENF